MSHIVYCDRMIVLSWNRFVQRIKHMSFVVDLWPRIELSISTYLFLIVLSLEWNKPMQIKKSKGDRGFLANRWKLFETWDSIHELSFGFKENGC